MAALHYVRAPQPCQSAFARAGVGLSAFAAILRSSTPQYSCSTLNSTPMAIGMGGRDKQHTHRHGTWSGGTQGVGVVPR